MPDPFAYGAGSSSNLDAVRSHAVSLARDAAMADLRDLHAKLPQLSGDEARVRRNRIHQQLRRLSPGSCTSLPAVLHPDGRVVTDPEEMAEALRLHWRATFAARRINAGLLDTWLQEELPCLQEGFPLPGLPPAGSAAWQLAHSHVEESVARSANSAPGPDGIPYLAWRRLGPLASTTLFEALRDLMTPEGADRLSQFYEDLGGQFNLGLLVLLPKKATGVDPLFGDYYAPGDTRPLSIVNTDNRVMANAVRIALEPVFERWVSEVQRGFLAGRSLLANVVDIDHEAMRVSLRCRHGAIILFDFRAAFPSISHDYIFKVLSHMGIPQELLHLFRAFYRENACWVVAGGRLHEGFAMSAGIRQGCPLSPLLFAVVVDLLLRRLGRLVPGIFVRAYADDVAVVVENLDFSVPLAAAIFDQFEQISGLALNISKTFLVPLFLKPAAEVLHGVARSSPGWGGIRVQGYATYLGFVLGPERQERSWEPPLRKLAKRAAAWGTLGLGMSYTMEAFVVYAFPVLQYVSQLDLPPSGWDAFEAKLVTMLFPGPFRWMPVSLAHRLRDLGMPRSLPHLADVSIATRLRVLNFENWKHGGLQVHRRVRQLDRWVMESEFIVRAGIWAGWYRGAFVRNLSHAEAHCAALGVSARSLMVSLAGGAPEPWDASTWSAVRAGFQRSAKAAVAGKRPMLLEVHLRRRLQRWQIPAFPRVRASRAAQMLARLRPLVPPRVVSAMLRTLLNGWCTKRRFQQGDSTCIFGCPLGSDSIEHYACCSRVWDFAWRVLALRAPDSRPQRMERFLLLSGACGDMDLARGAILVAAVYEVHNIVRHDPATPDRARDMLLQAARNAVRGHGAATVAHDRAWASPRQ